MRKILKLAAAAPCAACLIGAAAPDPEMTATAAGVRAVESHWGRAFVSGDAPYLEQLLADEYVSVNQSGRARPKAEIIELARKIASGPSRPQPGESTAKIVVHGNAAISIAAGDTDASVDVFFYEGDRWHAWYSQHSPVKPASTQ